MAAIHALSGHFLLGKGFIMFRTAPCRRIVYYRKHYCSSYMVIGTKSIMVKYLDFEQQIHMKSFVQCKCNFVTECWKSWTICARSDNSFS
jgi:hypothetical protein